MEEPQPKRPRTEAVVSTLVLEPELVFDLKSDRRASVSARDVANVVMWGIPLSANDPPPPVEAPKWCQMTNRSHIAAVIVILCGLFWGSTASRRW